MDKTNSLSDGRTNINAEVENMADALLMTFAENNVEYVFNSPGTEYAPFWELFASDTSSEGFPMTNEGLKYVGCRHEELAVQMAMGYTTLTGFPQVVALHVNVGALHAAMSINGAFRSRIPMVLLTSHADTHEEELQGGTPGGHYLDFEAPGGHENNYSRYTKWIAHPEQPENATRYLARAFRLTSSTPQRPVLVNLSRELLYNTEIDSTDIIREAPATPPAPSPPIIEQLTESLLAANNPIIIAGKTGWSQGPAEYLVALAERINVPVIENPKWCNGFPSNHPLSLGTLSDHNFDQSIDLVLVVETKRPWYPPESGAPDAEIIVLSSDPAKVTLNYWNYPADALITGDPELTITAVLERISDSFDAPTRPVDWETRHKSLRNYWQKKATDGRDSSPIDPFWLCAELNQSLPDDAIIIEETIVHQRLTANLFETKNRQFVSAVKALSNAIGGGLGIALGAKLAASDRLVTAVVGDGSYNYNPVSAAFGAAQEHDLPILVIIFNNGGYQSQKQSHMKAYPDGRAQNYDSYPGSQIQPTPEYVEQVKAWDVYSEKITDPSTISSTVETACKIVQDGKPALLDVVIEQEPPMVNPPS